MAEVNEKDRSEIVDDAQREKEAEERQSPSALIVHHAILKEGREELKRPSSALFWSGLAAGLSMGFSLAAEGALEVLLPEAEWTPAVSSFGYSVGFLFVTLGRQQLYTESTLVAALPAVHDKTRQAVVDMLRLWGIVLVTNLIGAFLFAATAANSEIFSPEIRAAFSAIGHEAMEHSFWTALLKGILGGWLVALMVWLLPASESARFWTIVVTTYVLAITGLTHIIAGSVETLYLVAAGELRFVEYLGGYMIPVLIGNTIGGVLLVTTLNHAQVMAEDSERSSSPPR